jgi:hypothetical protein
MPKDPQEFADLLGAKIVGEVPDVGGGPFGMARLAHLMHRGVPMRHDPDTISWLVCFPSGEEAATLKARLGSLLALDRQWIDQTRASPDGIEALRIETHRLSDYFQEIPILPGPLNEPSTFRLVFRRRPDAGRFWKDIMVRVLQDVRAAVPGVRITRDGLSEEELQQELKADR